MNFRWPINYLNYMQNQWFILNNKITLNHLELMSLLVSTLTFYSGVVFFDSRTSLNARYIMAAFVCISNIYYVLFMLQRVYYGMHVTMDVMVDIVVTEKASDAPVNGPGMKGGFLALLSKSYWLLKKKVQMKLQKNIN